MQRVNSRIGRSLCAFSLAVAVASTAHAAQNLWTGADANGFWDDAANWSNGIPGPTDDAVNTTAQAIQHRTTDDTINSFISNGGFTMNGGSITANVPGTSTFEVDNTFAFNTGTLDGFIINASTGGQSITFADSSSSVLTDITSNANLDLSNAGRVRINGGLTLGSGATATLGAGGVMTFDTDGTLTGAVVFTGASNQITVEGTSTLTIAATSLVHGSNAVIGSQIFVNGANAIVNNGTISADVSGGTITLESNSFTNTGTLSAANGGELSLNTSINNAGGIISIGAGSTVLVNGITITGGTINGPAALTFTNSNSNVLDGVTSNTNLDLTNGARTQIKDGLSLNAANSINLDNGAILAFDNIQAFATGTIDVGSDGTQHITVEGDSTLTLSSGVLIHGGNATIGNQVFVNGSNAIINNGTISADAAGGTITLESNSFTNTGTLSAANGGELSLNTSINNAGGIISVSAGSTVLVNGITITGGTINGPAALTFTNSNSNVLDGVTSNTNLDLTNGARTQIKDGLSLNAANSINLDNGAILAFDNTQAFATGTIDIGSDGTQHITVEGDSTLTLSSGVLIHGGNATIGNQVFVNGSNAIINNGTISADAAGGTITLESNSFTNTGTLSAANGGELALDTSINNAGGIISIGTGSTVLVNGITITGGTINGPAALTFANSNSNVLDGVTSNTNLDLTNGTRTRIEDGLSLNAANSINLDNGAIVAFTNTQSFLTGTINFGSDASQEMTIEGTTVLTLGAGAVIQGATGTIGNQIFVNGANTLTNNGLISANTAGGTLTVEPSIFNNAGTAQAINGGTLSIIVTTGTNTGTMSESGANSLLTLTGSIDNTGGSISGSSGGSIELSGGRITGGTITTTTGSTLVATINNANEVTNGTISAALDLSAGGRLLLNNSMADFITGTLDNGAILAVLGNTTLTGGTITFGSDSTQQITGEGGSALTIDAAATINGAKGSFGGQILVNGPASLTNQGTISCNVSGGTIIIGGYATMLNQGTLEAQNGGELQLDVSMDNTGGTIHADAGSTVLFNGIGITNGMLTGPGDLLFSINNANIISGVTVNGDVDLSSGGRVQIANGINLTGTIQMDNGADVFTTASASETIFGGTLNFGADGTQALTIEGSNTLTLAAGTLLHGTKALIGNQSLVNGTNALINQGTIDADGTAASFTIVANSFTNSGTVHTAPGANMTFTNGETQTAGSTISDGTITISGGLSVSGGTVGGNGTIVGAVNLSGGTLSPGDSPGHLSITATYTQGPAADILVELDGHTQGSSYDLLSVTGAVTLDGEVDVAVLPGFTPQVGDVFTFLTYGSRTGMFAGVDSLTDGYSYSIIYDTPEDTASLTILTVPAIPEPAILSVAALMPLLRRRRV